MYKSDAVAYYGTQEKLANTLRIKQGAVSQWDEIIPEKQAMRLERITNGALKYDPTLYAKAA